MLEEVVHEIHWLPIDQMKDKIVGYLRVDAHALPLDQNCNQRFSFSFIKGGRGLEIGL